MAAKTMIPKFRTEKEEADWWDAHPEVITELFHVRLGLHVLGVQPGRFAQDGEVGGGHAFKPQALSVARGARGDVHLADRGDQEAAQGFALFVFDL